MAIKEAMRKEERQTNEVEEFPLGTNAVQQSSDSEPSKVGGVMMLGAVDAVRTRAPIPLQNRFTAFEEESTTATLNGVENCEEAM